MSKSKRKKKPSFVGGFVGAHKEHWMIATGAYAVVAAALTVGTWIWQARDIIILKPEAVEAHTALSEQIQLASGKIDQLQQIRIDQLKVKKALKQGELERTRDRHLRENLRETIRNLEKQIQNEERLRNLK